jgi:hypothetical protein
MAEFTGVRTSADSSTETRQVRLVHERVFLYAPQYTPILMLKGGIMPGPKGERIKVKGLINSRFAPAKKIEWFDKELPSMKAYCEGAFSSTQTSVSIDDGTGVGVYSVRPGAVIKCENEIMFVTAYTYASEAATVIRGVGATSAVSHADNTAIYVLSNGVEENSTYQTRFGARATPRSNYMQIFRHDWAVSRSADVIRLYGGKDKAETMAEAAVQHVREMERQFTFGYAEYTGLTLNSLNVQLTGGLDEYNDGVLKTANSTGRFASPAVTHTAAIKYGEFVETFLVESFKYSSPRRRKMFVGGSVWGKVFGRFSTNVGNIQTYVRDTAFGVNVVEVMSPAGTIEFLTSGAIDEIESGSAFCFDPDLVEFNYVDNTFMVDNAQSKGSDGYAGYFLTEGCMKFEAIKTITKIDGVTGWSAES